MVVAKGTPVYEVQAGGAVKFRGVVFSDEDLEAALSDRVVALLWDDAGRASIEGLLTSVASTQFQEDRLREILEQMPVLEDWRIGEALAEAFLIDHRGCEFPWPTGRDQKNPRSSPAGTDLVGFHHEDGHPRFAFGEVKTSEQQQWPPSVVRGRHGMSEQLIQLRNSHLLKNQIILYLGHHAVSSPWSQTFREATARYLADPNDVSLFGFLIRDVSPKQADLATQAANLNSKCPPHMTIELHAMYLPSGAIAGLVERAVTARLGLPA